MVDAIATTHTIITSRKRGMAHFLYPRNVSSVTITITSGFRGESRVWLTRPIAISDQTDNAPPRVRAYRRSRRRSFPAGSRPYQVSEYRCPRSYRIASVPRS